ncbi:MAG: VWA domain-containing protein [Planctomycetaceae bacterium]|nr:VWA domain-containing protein [Planctomycetaceae bacterium]
MTFGHPQYLWLLIVPALLGLVNFRLKSHSVVMPFDHVQTQGRRWLPALARLAQFLPVLLLAVAILLLSRPIQSAMPEQERELTNIEIVLDVSGSMTSPYGEESRYDAAMKAINDFTQERKGDAFGLTIFGNEVLRWTPLTKDTSAIRSATPFLRPEMLPYHFGGTEIGKALVFSREMLLRRGEEGDRLIVLVSDGESADLYGNRSRTIGEELAASEIRLYAIHIGDGAAPEDLWNLTRPTGGQVFAANNPQALAAVFGHIDQMQTVKMKPVATQPVDVFGPFATVGLVLSGAFFFSLFGLRFTPW